MCSCCRPTRKAAIAETAIARCRDEARRSGAAPGRRARLATTSPSRSATASCACSASGARSTPMARSSRSRFESTACTPAGYVRNRVHVRERSIWWRCTAASLDRCYLLPSSLACGRTSVYLRLTPPKNGQRACINLASDFEFAGAVAQLVEHRHGMARARGSSPLSSTPSPAPPEVLRVGAHEFRNHFGYYLERAADGHEVLVSRRGRPYVRLLPVEPRLRLVAA